MLVAKTSQTLHFTTNAPSKAGALPRYYPKLQSMQAFTDEELHPDGHTMVEGVTAEV